MLMFWNVKLMLIGGIAGDMVIHGLALLICDLHLSVSCNIVLCVNRVSELTVYMWKLTQRSLCFQNHLPVVNVKKFSKVSLSQGERKTWGMKRKWYENICALVTI